MAVDTSGSFGGFMLATYSDEADTIVEAGMRTLIRADSDSVIDQEFKIDAEFAFYGENTREFDSYLQIYNANRDLFDAQLIIAKPRLNPYVTITDYPTGSGIIPFSCTLVASGHAYDKNRNIIQSGIHRVSFVWGDGDYTEVTTPVQSGFIWSATHTYNTSGIYKPRVIVADKTGRIGSAFQEVNIASGISSYPYILLSGSPRLGFVPTALTVDFGVTISGVLGAYTIYYDWGNGLKFFNNDLTQVVQYGMPGNYIPMVRIIDDRNLYIFDTLKIDYNR